MTSPSLPLSQKSAELFKKAEQAFDLRNYGYAMVLYRSVLGTSPEYHPARFKYHVAALKNEETNPKSIGQSALAFLGALKPYARAMWMTRKRNWMSAVSAWEDCLAVLPFSFKIHWENARCLEALGWTEAAMDEYRLLRNIAPANPDPLRELARLYCQEERWDEAREVYEALLKLSPNDPKAPSELRKIAAMHTIEKGGWKDTANYRDKIRDERQARLFEQQARLVKTPEEIDALLRALQEKQASQPLNTALAKEIAGLYGMKGDWEKAKAALREALKHTPGDYLLEREIQNIEMEQRKAAITRLRDQGKTQEMDTLVAEHRKALLRDKKAQVAQYPTNLNLRFELAEMFMDEGLVDEAIAEFQQAVKNPNKRLESQKYLGECFQRKRLFALAIEQLQSASESLKEMSALKKEILYALAGVYEEMGKTEEARREYEKIYAVDIAYRDVAQKIEKKFRRD